MPAAADPKDLASRAAQTAAVPTDVREAVRPVPNLFRFRCAMGAEKLLQAIELLIAYDDAGLPANDTTKKYAEFGLSQGWRALASSRAVRAAPGRRRVTWPTSRSRRWWRSWMVEVEEFEVERRDGAARVAMTALGEPGT